MNDGSILLPIAYNFRLFDLFRCLHRKRVVILMYHRFSDKPEPFKVTQRVFENQIKFLKEHYTFISLRHYSEILHGTRDDFPHNPIILTIDDGYWDNYAYAFPVLKKYHIPATIFLTTDFIRHKAWLWSNKLEYILRSAEGREFSFPLNGQMIHFCVHDFKSWHTTQLQIFNYLRTLADDEKNQALFELASRLKVQVPEQTVGDFLPLTWDQIMEMTRNNIDFGSHTCSHPILSRVSPNQLRYELEQSKTEIEKAVQREVRLFCYPNGKLDDFNESVIMMLRQLSYLSAVTAIPGLNKLEDQPPFLLRRVSVGTDDKMTLSRACAGL